jgi:hypothetical protein
MPNKIVYLKREFFRCWNSKGNAFSIYSPFSKSKNVVFWFSKFYYHTSKYDGYFGIEIPEYHFKTGEKLKYIEINYVDENTKKTKVYYAQQLISKIEMIARDNSARYQSFTPPSAADTVDWTDEDKNNPLFQDIKVPDNIEDILKGIN